MSPAGVGAWGAGVPVDWTLILLGVLALPPLVLGASLVYARLLFRPSIDRDVRGQLLILAAHPDDCVIVAGEYAQETRKNYGRVRVVYLTCGDTAPGSARAMTRREESVRAWSIVGVPGDDLIFLDIPEAPVNGTSPATPEQIARARTALAEIITFLPLNAAVFIPAAGETHPDHRLLRTIALETVLTTRRLDLRLFEAPEYNPYLSLSRSPLRALVYLMASLPLVARMVGKRSVRLPPAFFEGPPGRVLPGDAERLETKRRMLRAFESEKGELLVSLFGFPDLYRPVDAVHASKAVPGRWFIRMGDRFLSPSLSILWLTLWAGILVAFYMLARVKILTLGGSRVAVITTACLGVLLLLWAVYRRQNPERRTTSALAGMGLVAGAVAAEEAIWGLMLGG